MKIGRARIEQARVKQDRDNARICAVQRNSDMKGCIVANIKVTEPDRYQLYKDAAPEIIAAFGGRHLIKSPDIEVFEGDPPREGRFVVLEFDSLNAARACPESPAYQDIAAHRRASSQSDFYLMEGCSDPAAAFRDRRS